MADAQVRFTVVDYCDDINDLRMLARSDRTVGAFWEVEISNAGGATIKAYMEKQTLCLCAFGNANCTAVLKKSQDEYYTSVKFGGALKKLGIRGDYDKLLKGKSNMSITAHSLAAAVNTLAAWTTGSAFNADSGHAAPIAELVIAVSEATRFPSIAYAIEGLLQDSDGLKSIPYAKVEDIVHSWQKLSEQHPQACGVLSDGNNGGIIQTKYGLSLEQVGKWAASIQHPVQATADGSVTLIAS